MRNPIVLGIDCGTQGLRATAYTPDGSLLGEASHPYRTFSPRPQWAEQDPEEWWNALVFAVRNCVAAAGIQARDIAAMACDGTSFTGVFCRRDGTPLRPALLWMDIRAAAEAQEIEATHDPALQSCGGRMSPEWMLPKALWVARNEPEVYEEAELLVEGVDWLLHRLTERWVASTGSASGKRHWTPNNGWPVALYERFELDDLVDKCPENVVYAGAPVGTLTSAAASALALTPDCMVTHAGLDGWAAPIGMNALGTGYAALTLGTSTVVICETATPKQIPGVMGPYPDGVRKGRYIYEAGQTSGGSTVQWLLDLIGIRFGSSEFTQLEHAAVKLPPGAEGLVIFDGLLGNRTPFFDPHARGNICGLSLGHGPHHLYRALLEGGAFGIRNVFDAYEKGGLHVQEVCVNGSGARNELWLDIIASVTGRPLQVSSVPNATCLGAAACATVAIGAHPDLAAAASAMAPSFQTVWPKSEFEAYEALYEIYLETYDRMKESMHRLAAIASR